MPIIKQIDEAMKLLEQYRNKQLIPVDWIKSRKTTNYHEEYDYVRGCFDGYNDCIDTLIMDWEAKIDEAD